MPRCPLTTPKMAILQGFPQKRPSTSKSSSARSARRCADPAPIPGRRRRRGGAARRAGGGRAALARLGRPLAPPATRRSRRHRHARQGGAAQAHALVRRAARVRPALVQRRRAPPDRRPAGAGRPAAGRARGIAQRQGVATMRIAVCRPQVPFAYGGAEIFTDTLVERAARAGARGGDRLGPVQVVPGRPGADAGLHCGACSTSTESDGQADRHGRRDEVPVVRRAPPREAGLARAPVPAGLRARPHLARAVRRVHRGQGRAPQGAGPRPRRARRGEPPVRDLRNVAGRLQRSTGLVAEVLPHPAAGARLPLRRPRRLRPLGQPARSRQARRPADRGSRARALAPGRRRRRGAGRRPARQLAADRGVNGRVRFAGRVDATRAGRPLRHVLRLVLRAGRRGLRPRAATSRSSPASR